MKTIKAITLITLVALFAINCGSESGIITEPEVVVVDSALIKSKNKLPIANAGLDQTITLPVNTVTLDGTTSTDPDGTIKYYLWTKTSGPSQSTILNPNSAQTAVNDLVEGDYVFNLKVTDNLKAISNDDVLITVKPEIVIPPPPTPTMPVYDHIFVVWMENKPFSSIVGSSSAQYTNGLISQGALFTNYFALQNPSQPNYIGTFAGTRCGISNNDDPLNGTGIPTLTELNLYTQLKEKGKTFITYAEDLPSVGSMVWGSGKYAGRHDPARNFANVDQTSRKPFTSIPSDLNLTATVNFLIPNNDHNTHDQSVSYGDNWLRDDPKIQAIINYCKNPQNNSLFVLYYDEGNSSDNRIAVTFIGNRVKANAKIDILYNHYNLTHTIISMYGGTQVNSAATVVDLEGWYD